MREILQNLTPLDEDNWRLFTSAATTYTLAKGEFLLRPGQVCRSIYFLQTGLLRSFYVLDGDERTVAFNPENTFVTDLKSLRSERPTELTIQALDPSIILGITRTDLIQLYQTSHQIEAFGRSLLERLLAEQEEYATWFKLYPARTRYTLFLQKQPELVQRLSLSHLASFLGIRRETLSRIRRLK